MGRHHLPVARTAELMADAFGAPVSTGWLASLQPRAKKLLEPFLEAARARVRHAGVAHFDETGARVQGKLAWVHVASTGAVTLLHLAPARSGGSIEAGGILGHGFNGVAVHAGLPAYRRYPVRHGLCNAHHLRELAGIAEAGGQDWPLRMADLLVEMLVAVDGAKAAGKTSLNKWVLRGYRRRYRRLIARGVGLNPLPPPTGKRGRPAMGPVRSLLKRLDTYEDDVLRFAHDFTGSSRFVVNDGEPGKVEANNTSIKNIKRTGRGFVNGANYTTRIMLAKRRQNSGGSCIAIAVFTTNREEPACCLS
ncbi:IS66 family transposase [Pseudarthrobacter sp. P1]|uniref:IS66 family transposase n=1 Tax=Pseudarthrobacter sp. P1 TaxID=3418418 RepID=UPI003CF73EDD